MFARDREISISHSLLRLAPLLLEALDGRACPPMLIDERLARFAVERHQVGPLLYFSTSGGHHAVSPAVRDYLEASYRESADRRNASIARLHRIGASFASRGIFWMVLKGPPQAEVLYPDPAWRSSADIDLLVSPRDFSAAFDALLDVGFVAAYPPVPASRFLRYPVLKALRDVTLIAADDPHCAVELHRRLFIANDRRARSLQLQPTCGVVPAPALGPSLALYVVAHGALSLWIRLKWLVDLLPLFEKLSDKEKLASCEYARRAGAENSFAASLLLLRAIFPSAALTPLSSWLDEKQRDPAVWRRVRRYAIAISLERESERSPFDSALVAFESNWLLFEAATTRAAFVVSAARSSIMRRCARWASRFAAAS